MAAVLGAVLLLAAPAGARQSRSVKLRFPPVSVSPGGTSEGCAFVRIPGGASLDVAGGDITNHARGLVVLHAIVYVYRGERLAEFASQAGRVVFSRGCLDLGPEDRDRRQMIAAITATKGRIFVPDGVALRLAPVPATPGGVPDGIGILIDVNWQNRGKRPRRASALVVLRRARPGSVRRIALPFSDRTAELGLGVPPFRLGSTEVSTSALNAARPGEPAVRDAWAPAAEACVLTLAPQMHRRARFFGVDLIGTDGGVRNPPGGTPNPFESPRTHLYGAVDYTDPGLRIFAPSPLLVRAGESVHYLCWHDNGVIRAVRLGCDEVLGTAPGGAAGRPGGGPAKPCSTPNPAAPECPAADPAYPGRTFTGACVPANVVAGPTPDDEVCGITGTYFDAVPGAAPGSECDVAALPPIG
ncbi:MAG TPA: hypothetical protein VEM57_06705 [Candidatus Binatus sp.]|nr:hypothetical protein [Candidatus Binatus sp.]